MALCALATGQSRAATPCLAFGTVADTGGTHAICWQPAAGTTVTPTSMQLRGTSSTLRSQAVTLHAGHLYDVSATMRRGPGTQIELALFTVDDKGARHVWRPIWQFPERARPGWIPISPALRDYVQGVVVLPNTHEAYLELRLTTPERAELSADALWELTQLSLTDRMAVRTHGSLGPNQLVGGDMETADGDGWPQGWTEWQRAGASHARAIAVSDAHRGGHVLRVAPDTTTILAAGALSVTHASAWQISTWVRGRGRVRIMAHPLSDESPSPKRVGVPQDHTYAVNTTGWQRLDQAWYAEAPHVSLMQIVIAVTAQSNLDIDDVAVRVHR